MAQWHPSCAWHAKPQETVICLRLFRLTLPRKRDPAKPPCGARPPANAGIHARATFAIINHIKKLRRAWIGAP